MSTHASTPSFLARRALLLSLVVTACAGEATEGSPNQPETPAASAAAATSPVPAPTEPPATAPSEAVPAEPPAPEPPPPPNATPAELRLTAYGRCKYMGVSTVDGRTLLHYRWGEERGFVHRMDEHGRIAETMRFDEGFHWDPKDPSPWKERYFAIEKLAGRWPSQLVLLATTDYRETEIGHLWRRIDDGWARIETLGNDMIYQDVWPWHDGSILAWAHTDAETSKQHGHRLAVVRGEGKGPSLARLRKRASCESYDFELRDVHVQDDGKVLATASCGGAWLATWTPDDLEGTVHRVDHDGWRPSLHIDARGQGYVLSESSLFAWDGTTLTPVEAPNGRGVEKVFVGRDGEAWILQGRTLSRRTADGWEPVAVPDHSPVTHVAGLQHGTPWLLHEDGTLSMQTADGAWHPVPLPPTPDLNKVPRATTIHVVGPGDVWIEGTYFRMNKGSKHVGKPFWAAFTTRDAPTAFECGKEPNPVPEGTPVTTDAPAPAKEQARP